MNARFIALYAVLLICNTGKAQPQPVVQPAPMPVLPPPVHVLPDYLPPASSGSGQPVAIEKRSASAEEPRVFCLVGGLLCVVFGALFVWMSLADRKSDYKLFTLVQARIVLGVGIVFSGAAIMLLSCAIVLWL